MRLPPLGALAVRSHAGPAHLVIDLRALDDARTRLAELDLSIRRIEGGDYGRCEVCGTRIAEERLEAVPTTRTCVACAG